MEEWINILLKAFWSGCAAMGFGILFHVPKRNLAAVWMGGAIAGLIKFSVLKHVTPSIILASFLAALILGIYSMIVAHKRREPPLMFAIPSVIPLVPGLFAYRTMLGLMKLSGDIGPDFSRTLSETVHDGVLTLFIIIAFTIGIVLPYQVGKDISKKIY
jgi:uncharacterized membrane protein YjjB (DUF3815 family)